MWREEVGITEMLLAYIGEFVEFDGWSSWRKAVIDILTCHENARRERTCSPNVSGEFMDKTESFDKQDVTEDVCTEKISHSTVKERLPTDETINSGSQFGLGSNVTSNEDVFDRIGSALVKQEDVEMDAFQIEALQNEARSLQLSQNLNFPYRGDQIESHPFETISSVDDVSLSFGAPSKIIVENPGRSSKCHTLDVDPMRKLSKKKVNSRNLRCKFCSMIFRNSSHLIQHERTHTGQQPFVCNFCGKPFDRVSDRDRHERTHTGEKPFSCSICSMRFNVRSNKVRHERRHILETK